MSQVINTNVISLNAQRNLNVSAKGMSTAIERLSSGLRINSAKDDAAGLAISTRFTAQINGLNQAVRNANDGISLLQVAEGAMQETTNVLQRMRQLAVQSANGTNSSTDRSSLQDELVELKAELDRIGNNTTFNNLTVVKGTFSSTALKFQVGANEGEYLSIKISDVRGQALSVASLTIGSVGGASVAIAQIDKALDTISTSRAKLGAIQNRFEYTISNITNVSNNLSAARSRILDTDYAAETASLTKFQILQQAGVAMLAQANASPQSVLSLLQ